MKTMTKICLLKIPQEYEEWLEELGSKGWHLTQRSGFGIHHFVEGKSYKVRYCDDYQGKKKPEYEKIFIDLGWNLIKYSWGSYLWEKEYEGERPEAFTDYESLMLRNKREFIVLVACCIFSTAVIISHIIDRYIVSLEFLFCVTFDILGLFTMVKFIINNIKLKKIKP